MMCVFSTTKTAKNISSGNNKEAYIPILTNRVVVSTTWSISFMGPHTRCSNPKSAQPTNLSRASFGEFQLSFSEIIGQGNTDRTSKQGYCERLLIQLELISILINFMIWSGVKHLIVGNHILCSVGHHYPARKVDLQIKMNGWVNQWNTVIDYPSSGQR